MANKDKFPELSPSLSLEDAGIILEGKKVKFQKKVALLPVSIEEYDVLKAKRNGATKKGS